MPEFYRVLRGSRSAEIRDKGSKFLALVEPAADAESARAFRERQEKGHRGASHHCWAERLGWPAEERSSDDGEPRGTAGEPIARVLRAHELSDVVAVVVRWFGGVKLGKGGLARAYSGAVSEALEGASLETCYPMADLRVRLAYDKVGAVQHLARAHGAEWREDLYGVEVEATLRMRADRVPGMRLALADLRVETDFGAEDGS